jgi:uncharacterized integral membrane protein
MNKVKVLFLVVLVAVLMIFVMQNWVYPNPPIHFLGFEFLPFPQSVIIFGFFILGFLGGWLTNAFRVKHHKQEAPLEKPKED